MSRQDRKAEKHAYYLKNREKLLEYSKKYQQEHQEELKEYRKKHYQENAERYRENERKRYQEKKAEAFKSLFDNR